MNMMTNKRQWVRRTVFLCIAVCTTMLTTAEVRLPQFISDGMVLQQQADVRLWGWVDKFYGGTANRTVTVTTSWDGRQYTAKSDADGRFEVTV